MTRAVGADVESICSKCGDVWHVIVAKVGDKIARVLCKECGREHRHKPPGGPEKKSPVQKAAGKATAPRVKAQPAVRQISFDASRPPRRYSPVEEFAPGDRVEHASFGLGIVQTSPGPGKIEVVFPSGRKVLAQAKPALTLTRPPNA